jgi:hypothetical protein
MSRIRGRCLLLTMALVALACGLPSVSQAWTPPINLSADADVTNFPGIAVASDWTLHAVWTDQTTREMKYSSRPPGGAWSAPEIVGTYAGTTSWMDGEIVVAVGPDGTVHILYVDDATGDSEIYHRSKPLGGVWSSPVNISQTPGTRSEFPDIAVSPDGTVHAVWDDGTPSNSICCHDTYYASKTVAGSWMPAIDLSNSVVNEYPCRVGVGPDNSVHVISAQEDGGPGMQNIYYYYKPLGGSFGPAVNLTGTANMGRGMGDVLMTGDGTVHVVFYAGAPLDVFYMNKPVCGSWSSPVNLSNASASWIPALAADACGNLHAVWYAVTGGVPKVMYSARLTSGSWSAPVDLSGGAASECWPQVATGGPSGPKTGTVEVVYLSSSSGNTDAFLTESPFVGCDMTGVVGVEGNPGQGWTSAPGDGIRAIPNPMTGQVRFEARATRSASCITVYDMAGRALRVLPFSTGAQGWTDVEWDGRDASGRKVPAGVYWARMGSGSQETATRVVLIQ